MGTKHWKKLGIALSAALVLCGCSAKMEEDAAGTAVASAPGKTTSTPAAMSSGGGGGMGGQESDNAPAANMKAQDYDETASGGDKPAGAGDPTAKSNSAALKHMTDSQPDRYLIKNAVLTLECEDARKSLDALVVSVKAARGYVSDVQETVDSVGTRQIFLQVRVPARDFDPSMQQIASLGKVLDRRVTAEDVTEEFVDTQAKLRNLKRTEERLLAHLQKTGKLSDTLLVETELTRVREEIEQHEGRVRFLSHRITYSTIQVTLKEAARQQALVPPESYSVGKEASDATRSLIAFGRNLLSVVIWMGIWAIIWVPLTAGTLFGLRWLVKTGAFTTTAKPTMTETGRGADTGTPSASGGQSGPL